MLDDLKSIIAQCEQNGEPACLELAPHQAEKGWGFPALLHSECFPLPLSSWQIGFLSLNPGVVKAWHQLKEQTLLVVCLRGDLRVAVVVQTDEKPRVISWMIGEHSPTIVVIPPGLWHGFSNILTCSVDFIYFFTAKPSSQSPFESCLASTFTQKDGDPKRSTTFAWSVHELFT